MRRLKREILSLQVGAELLRLSALLSGLGCYVILEGIGQEIYPALPGIGFAALAALLGIAQAHASSLLDTLEHSARQELERRRSLSGLEPRDWRRIG